MAHSGSDWSLYPYDPVKALPIVFAVIVFLLALLHFYQTFIQYRWPRFGISMMLASAIWISGFICRAVSVYNVQNVPVYIAQYVLILVGPPFYAAAETFILGRLFAYLPYHAPIHPGRVVSTFILLSAVVEVLTANGASRISAASSDNDSRQLGFTLVKVALILQAAIEVGFSSLVALLQLRCVRAGHFTRNVRTMCIVLYTTSMMMLVRCVVRAVEGFEGAACAADSSTSNCGAVTTHEWFLWVFEVANITVFIAAWAVFTPGKYLPTSDKQYLDPVDCRTEHIGPGFSNADKRPWLVTVFDPFNLGGIICGKGMDVDKFWERDNPIAPTNFSQPKKGSKDYDDSGEELEVK